MASGGGTTASDAEIRALLYAREQAEKGAARGQADTGAKGSVEGQLGGEKMVVRWGNPDRRSDSCVGRGRGFVDFTRVENEMEIVQEGTY